LRKARSARAVPTLRDDAARVAYRAGSLSAQALIVERFGKIAKTHHGLRACFARLVDKEPRLDRTLTRFLGRGHQFEQLVDYGLAPQAEITESEVWQVLDLAATLSAASLKSWRSAF
jgi:uncharacterized protein (UPF0332 family)